MMSNLHTQQTADEEMRSWLSFRIQGTRSGRLDCTNRRQVHTMYHGGIMVVHDEVTIELDKYVGSFARVEPRPLEWYQRAAERYAANLARRFDWVYQAPDVELVRIMDTMHAPEYPMGKVVEMAKCVVVLIRATINPGVATRLLPSGSEVYAPLGTVTGGHNTFQSKVK